MSNPRRHEKNSTTTRFWRIAPDRWCGEGRDIRWAEIHPGATNNFANAIEDIYGDRLDAIVLRSSWRWHHIVGIGWLFTTYRQIRRKAERGEIDAVLFSSMVPAALATVLRRTLEPRGIPMAAIAHGRDVTQPGPYHFKEIPSYHPASRWK